MKTILSYIFKLVGLLVMAVAFAQWFTFFFPGVIPFWPVIFSEGLVTQVLNWGIVCIAGACGWKIFSYGGSFNTIPKESN